ncbi:hypothetical protein DPMN_112854 [Dreissena polymorpha]|uniref:Uncharacterized protein n=1 Tax=Dreissena polymorpha TaxID=45954 RepID=A0A9D4KH67_DREPO|nr:hypothetical protein DPMN_112854 [Dreissena polymorpha]
MLDDIMVPTTSDSVVWKAISANRLAEDFTESGKSLMWQRNSRGPRTVPHGTSESTIAGLDSSPFL